METIGEWQILQRNAHPSNWSVKGYELWAAARAVRASVACSHTEHDPLLCTSFRSVELMLRGMAFEAWFKGIRIARPRLWDRIVYELRPYLGSTTHQLVALAASAKVDLSDEESRVLEILSQYVKWRGRYPAEHKFTRSFDSSNWNTRFDPVVDALALRVVKILSTKVKRAFRVEGAEIDSA